MLTLKFILPVPVYSAVTFPSASSIAHGLVVKYHNCFVGLLAAEIYEAGALSTFVPTNRTADPLLRSPSSKADMVVVGIEDVVVTVDVVTVDEVVDLLVVVVIRDLVVEVVILVVVVVRWI